MRYLLLSVPIGILVLLSGPQTFVLVLIVGSLLALAADAIYLTVKLRQTDHNP